MAHFFDTILVENVLKGMMNNRICALLMQGVFIMNSEIKAKVITGSSISESKSIETGLRQGGRFSTTGAKLALQVLNAPLRLLKNVLIGRNDEKLIDYEFGDDCAALTD